MRRDTLVAALENVRRTLVSTKVYQLMQYLTRARPEKDRPPLPDGFMKDALESYAQFMIAYRSFGPEEKLVLNKFQLEELSIAETWISPRKPTERELDLSVRVRQARDCIPAFVELLIREADTQPIVVERVEKKEIQQIETKRITFLIRESDSPTLTMRDLTSILNDIENLFQAIVRIQNIQPSDLIVTALDSGSEKSIDIAGVASAIDKLSAFLLEAWDRIRFARSSKVRASIKAASEGIALLNELKVAQEKGAINPDEGEKIRRVIIKSVDELFVKGVYTKQMETLVPLQPSQIDYQRTKLITHYTDQTSQGDRKDAESDEELSED